MSNPITVETHITESPEKVPTTRAIGGLICVQLGIDCNDVSINNAAATIMNNVYGSPEAQAAVEAAIAELVNAVQKALEPDEAYKEEHPSELFYAGQRAGTDYIAAGFIAAEAWQQTKGPVYAVGTPVTVVYRSGEVRDTTIGAQDLQPIQYDLTYLSPTTVIGLRPSTPTSER